LGTSFHIILKENIIYKTNMENKSDNTIFGVENTNEPLEQKAALAVFVNAVQVAQSRGAWRIEESSILHKAIQAFTKT
jgi:hypothetical protein